MFTLFEIADPMTHTLCLVERREEDRKTTKHQPIKMNYPPPFPIPAIVLATTIIPVEDKPDFKIPTTRCPILESLIYCAARKWGITLFRCDAANRKITFMVTDFDKYYSMSCAICSKERPSGDLRSRLKTLKIWFVSVPGIGSTTGEFLLITRTERFDQMYRILRRVKNTTLKDITLHNTVFDDVQ
jgi:hypothetical protein